MMHKRGQGTIEYLVIIAIVVVIALVVVGLLLQIMNQGSGVHETSAKAAWKSAEPFAIVDWSATGTTLTLVLKNNSFEALDFKDMYLTTGNSTSAATSNIAPGATVTKTISITSCTSGSKYSYPKSGIYIDYNSSTIAGKKQIASADIVGTCS